MASSRDFVEYACTQLQHAGNISCRKMFGEYGVYFQDRFIGCICDNQLFLKRTPSGERLLPDGVLAPPYPGAGLSYRIENLEDTDLLCALLHAMVEELPPIRPKKRAGRNSP